MSTPKIALCTPAYDGRAHNTYWRGIRDIQKVLDAEGFETLHVEVGHSANLPRLRNALTAISLDWEADAIVWIDSDIAASGNDVLALWNSGKAIIGAAPQKRPQQYDEPPVVAFSPLPGGQIKLERGLIEVGKVATAFLLTRREVYATLAENGTAKRLAPRNGEKPSNWYRNYFWYELIEDSTDPETGDQLYADDGEDYYFCRKAVEAGFRCFIHPGVRPIHHGSNVRLPLNFWDLHGHLFQEVLNGDENAQ